MGTVNIQQYREFLTDIYNVVYDFSEKFRIRLQYRRIRPPAQPGTIIAVNFKKKKIIIKRQFLFVHGVFKHGLHEFPFRKFV